MTKPTTRKSKSITDDPIDIRRRRSYGKEVYTHRKEMGITQGKLAELIGIKKSHMSHIESGRFWSSLPVYRKLCDVLKVGVPPLMK